jgi:hypothetical protein
MRRLVAFMSIAITLFASLGVQADCPDLDWTCPDGTTITEGQCWNWDTFACALCDPSHARCNRRVQCNPPIESRADGCSADLLRDPASVKLKEDVFKSACNNHDICYSTPGAPRERCDKNFYFDMESACKSNYWFDGPCVAAAQIWYAGIRLKGQSSFDGDQAWAGKHCHVE